MLNVKNRAFLIELLNRRALNVALVNRNQRLSTLKGLSFLIWDMESLWGPEEPIWLVAPWWVLSWCFLVCLVSDLWPVHFSRYSQHQGELFLPRPLIDHSCLLKKTGLDHPTSQHTHPCHLLQSYLPLEPFHLPAATIPPPLVSACI